MFPPEPASPRLTFKAWWTGVLLPSLFLGLVVTALACIAYTSTKELVRNNVENELRAIARLKVAQIGRWLARRHDDAELVATQHFRQELKRWLDGGQRDENLRQHLLQQLTISPEVTESRLFHLHAINGKILLSDHPALDTETAQHKAREAAQTGQERVEPLYFALPATSRSDTRAPLRLGYLTPLRTEKAGPIIAVLHSLINPEDVLFPLLQTWPSDSPSAETMILKQEGDHILYLNNLRHLPNAALRKTLSSTDQNLIANKVITQGAGFYEGYDYRGIRSLGYGMAVPHSPLFLVAKIDHDEVFADLNTLTTIMSIACTLLLMAFAAWQHHRKQSEHRLKLLLEERQIMQENMIATQDRLRQLAQHDDDIREAERKHVARELHDELGQLLTTLKMHLALLQMKFDRISGVKEKVEEMRLIVDKTIATVRNIVHHLRPPTLDLGLSGALEWQAEEFTRHTGIICTFEYECCEPCMDAHVVAIIFRLVQESLTNIARHAHATQVSIHLKCENNNTHLSIRDDGVGFNVDEITRKRKNFGLVGMQERIHLLHGQFKITSAPGAGTRIDIELPYTPPNTPTPP